jgi:hypothetical protein
MLYEVMNSGHSWAAERAQYALQVQEALQNNQISADEAREVLNDLVDTDKLNQVATDQQVRAALVFGVQQIISLC